MEIGGRSGSFWRREVANIRDGVSVVRGWWIEECTGRKFGSWSNTFFWTNPWLGGLPLCVRLRRPFHLAENKSISVAEMCGLGWEESGAPWKRRCRAWAWEEEVLRGV